MNASRTTWETKLESTPLWCVDGNAKDTNKDWQMWKSKTDKKRTLSPRMDEGLPREVVFIPMGPWANVLVGPDTGGCGTPHFKGVKVEVVATDEPIQDIRDLFLNRGGAQG